jgi:hypothetical protein
MDGRDMKSKLRYSGNKQFKPTKFEQAWLDRLEKNCVDAGWPLPKTVHTDGKGNNTAVWIRHDDDGSEELVSYCALKNGAIRVVHTIRNLQFFYSEKNAGSFLTKKFSEWRPDAEPVQ